MRSALASAVLGALRDDPDALDELRELLQTEQPTHEQPDPWMRTRDAAAYLGVSVGELHRAAAAGRVPHQQEAPGHALFFRTSDLDAWRLAGGRRGSL